MPSNAPALGKNKRIFIVEDDPGMVRLHLAFLSGLFEVVIRLCGSDAIQYLRKNHPIDLAVIDMKLPDISGLEVLKEIKQKLPSVPAIIITGFGSEDVAVKAFRCGARDYVKKPFIYHELIKRINFCLSLNIIEQEKHRNVLTNESEEFTETLIRDAKGSRNYYVQQAQKFIHNNFSADITLEQVANTACLSKYHFSRVFKETTGLTYQSYLNRVRIEQAKKFLDDNSLSITDVGYCAGYADLTHFTRIFKKLVGSTPSQYRRQRTSQYSVPK
ncbi:MAG TPA: DNA-binding response regulator [Nitrospirota bacterium]|nr:DNA-binding response regulator [Nitrospirota bacterium]